MDDIEREEFEMNAEIKRDMKNAKRNDFQLVVTGNDFYPYAVALHGCYDMAKFKRRADAERFIGTFAV